MLHRWVMEQVYGPLPREVDVMHRCDNPPCYRFDHLVLGNAKLNAQDMVNKGRVARGERNGRSKLTADQVADIRRRLAAGSETMSALGREYDVHRTAILRLRDGASRRA